jgi:acetylornithine deacetylase/succinyl-diaminopimelate desuccinylase-like protein
MIVARPVLLAAAMACAAPLCAQAPAPGNDPAAASVQSAMASPAFRAASARLDADYDRTVAELIRITETPAPPFKEAARAKLFADMLRALGLRDVKMDAEGNVTALRPGTRPGGKLLVVSAHLDTVFPEGTPIKVRREGHRLFAPGIGDDSLGLASLLAWIRAMDAAKVETRDGILFVGTVGEEGQGDLRGVRHFFTKGEYKDRVGAFLSVDGTDATEVTHGAVGSRRYRVTFSGPGGHSYGAFGIVNPMAAMADFIQRLYRVSVPAEPKTTYSASVTGGGTSVNSIPNETFIEVDMRSSDPVALQRLERRMLAIVAEAVSAENHARSTSAGEIKAAPKLIGDRPAGKTELSHPLVQTAIAAIRAHGLTPVPDYSSTDSNIPMSLGIPALTIGSGGGGGRAHALDEYLDVERTAFVRGMSVGLALIMAAAGAQ